MTDYDDIFISKLDYLGNFIWAKSISEGSTWGTSIALDSSGNVYTTGHFEYATDFDPGAGIFNLTSAGDWDIFISKLDPSGNFLWATSMGGGSNDHGTSIALDGSGNVYTTGYLYGSSNFDPGPGIFNLTSAGSTDIFILKLAQQGIIGKIYLDINENCTPETNEAGIINKKAIVNPGNILVETNEAGIWGIDSLAPGNYTITYDTSGKWKPTCANTQSFTVTDPKALTYVAGFGLVSTEPCPDPNVSILMPRMRPGFSDQNVFIKACNESAATGGLINAYVDVELDSLLTLQSATKSYTALGNNIFRFQLDPSLNPGQCANFHGMLLKRKCGTGKHALHAGQSFSG